ncbi:hypothetical protein BpHYR1_027982, partial [Brachionus plicatilis]
CFRLHRPSHHRPVRLVHHLQALSQISSCPRAPHRLLSSGRPSFAAWPAWPSRTASHFVEFPRPKLVYVAQLSAFGEELGRVLAADCYVVGYGPEKLDDVGYVVLVARVVLAAVWLEQVVAGGQLERHACQTPDVGACCVARAQDDLQRAILPRLNVLGEMVIGPAGVAQVRYFYLQDFQTTKCFFSLLAAVINKKLFFLLTVYYLKNLIKKTSYYSRSLQINLIKLLTQSLGRKIIEETTSTRSSADLSIEK